MTKKEKRYCFVQRSDPQSGSELSSDIDSRSKPTSESGRSNIARGGRKSVSGDGGPPVTMCSGEDEREVAIESVIISIPKGDDGDSERGDEAGMGIEEVRDEVKEGAEERLVERESVEKEGSVAICDSPGDEREKSSGRGQRPSISERAGAECPAPNPPRADCASPASPGSESILLPSCD